MHNRYHLPCSYAESQKTRIVQWTQIWHLKSLSFSNVRILVIMNQNGFLNAAKGIIFFSSRSSLTLKRVSDNLKTRKLTAHLDFLLYGCLLLVHFFKNWVEKIGKQIRKISLQPKTVDRWKCNFYGKFNIRQENSGKQRLLRGRVIYEVKYKFTIFDDSCGFVKNIFWPMGRCDVLPTRLHYKTCILIVPRANQECRENSNSFPVNCNLLIFCCG